MRAQGVGTPWGPSEGKDENPARAWTREVGKLTPSGSLLLQSVLFSNKKPTNNSTGETEEVRDINDSSGSWLFVSSPVRHWLQSDLRG